MKLGSLFDGSGGFPLAGLIHGIIPAWASEIEPYPLRVTAARLPDMLQLGDVRNIDGSKIEPVDIITFGSPCQDLSVAGKQAGIIHGERSNLFFEAIRIIREMRDATADKFPRFAVWENVPGAFSSHKGADFQAVIQAFCQIRGGTNHIVPLPPKSKWQRAGCVVGDGFSVAWRQYDAQFWGVPQRRKRIYLIADFGGERAGEILFERESVPWYSAPGQETREGTSQHPAGSVGRGCLAFMWANSGRAGISAAETSPTIKANRCGEPGVCFSIQGNIIDRNSSQNGNGVSEGIAHTITAADMHGVCYPAVARSLCARHDSSPCVDRGQNIVCYAPDGNHCGAFIESDKAATLQTRYHYGSGGDGALAVYDARGNGDGKTVPTLTGDHQNRVTDYTALALARCQNFSNYEISETSSTIKQRDYKGTSTDIVIERKPPRKYIVRRLTPLECCRLQGFPDWWENGVEGSDSARYRMWGNGIALPCAADVLGRIAKEMRCIDA